MFNVAVTRARAVLHVIGNQTWASACGIKFIEKFSGRLGSQSAPVSDAIFESPWEKALFIALQDRGVTCVPQYPIAGRRLDLALLSPGKIDIEIDGEAFHRTASGGRKDDDLWRDLQLKSLGWTVQRFWVYQLREDMPKCVAKILELRDRFENERTVASTSMGSV